MGPPSLPLSLPPSPPASSSPSLKKKLTHQASFVVFKTCLSFLALLGKSSQFRRWDGGLLEGEGGREGGMEGGRAELNDRGTL